MSLSFKTLTGTLLNGLFGDAEESESDRPVLGLDMLSSFLPYRVYEPQTRLYLNARSTGFILNVAPLVGADERVGDLLGQFLSEGLPAGACVQIVHWASPRISRNIAPWFAPRYARGGVYEQIARARTQCLYDLVWTSGSGGAPFHARHHQLLISVGVADMGAGGTTVLVSEATLGRSVEDRTEDVRARVTKAVEADHAAH